MSNPFDDVPVQGGMATTGNNNSNTRNTKRESTTLGYVNITLGGMRIGSVQIETNPYNFSSNKAHKTLLELFSYDAPPEELKRELLELIQQYGLDFSCQLAGSEKNVEPLVDYSTKFAGRSKRVIKS